MFGPKCWPISLGAAGVSSDAMWLVGHGANRFVPAVSDLGFGFVFGRGEVFIWYFVGLEFVRFVGVRR